MPSLRRDVALLSRRRCCAVASSCRRRRGVVVAPSLCRRRLVVTPRRRAVVAARRVVVPSSGGGVEASLLSSNLHSQFFVTSYFFLQPKSGNRRTSLRDRAEGDGSGKPTAWGAALRLTRRPTLSSVFWRVGTGRGHGLEYDGRPQCSPLQSQARPFFVGTCIYANVSRKQYHSLTFAGGE